MNRAAVLGSPIAHSLSPVLHRAGYAALGLADWAYDSHQVEADELAVFVAGLNSEWRGLSLTMPLKVVCLQVADEVTATAARAEAGNTLVSLGDGRWRADNTDIAGVIGALQGLWPPGCTRAVVLGAGATARSALLALAALGVREVSLRARDLRKATALLDWVVGLSVGIHGGTVGALADWGRGGEPVVVSTLPPQAAAASGIGGRKGGLLLDVVYADWPTPLARAAAASGMTVVSGLDMLVHQAARQFELFTGWPAPIEAMLVAGRAALGRDTR